MKLADIKRTLATATACIGISAASFLITTAALSQEASGADERAQTSAALQEKAATGDKVAQFGVSVRSALKSRP